MLTVKIVLASGRCKLFDLLYLDRKCSVNRNCVKQELALISFKQASTESSLGEQVPYGVGLLFPNGFRVYFGNASENADRTVFRMFMGLSIFFVSFARKLITESI